MKKNIKRLILFIVPGLVGVALGGILFYLNGRPAPIPTKEKLFTGVTYERKVRLSPRPLMIDVVKIDVNAAKIRFLVTPPDDVKGKYPLLARTTTEFLNKFGVQIAVNGDGFLPWWSKSILDYYPHAGDPVAPLGNTASRGKFYWKSDEAGHTLYISRWNDYSFTAVENPYNAISGDSILVRGGSVIADLDNMALQPRTAFGFSSNGRFIYFVVVDGRQPLYSEGMTRREMADLMISLGAQNAMNLDGGGSSTLVVEGKDGRPRILNSPIDNYIPGRERPVADHLGVFVDK